MLMNCSFANCITVCRTFRLYKQLQQDTIKLC